MPTLELPPPDSAPEPVKGPVLRDAFITYFTQVSSRLRGGIMDATVQRSIADAHQASHVIATWDTPYCPKVPEAAGAYEDYFFERHGRFAEIVEAFDKPSDVMAFEKTRARAILRPAIIAYALSGLAITDSTLILHAADAYHQDWSWVRDLINEGTAEAIGKLDVRDPLHRWNRKYLRSLGDSAMSLKVPGDPQRLTKKQKRALEEAGVDLGKFFAHSVAGPDTGETAEGGQ